MSTDVTVCKAVVHSIDANTGICHVKIPSITGQKIVPVSTEGLTEAVATGIWNVPRVGDLCLVAITQATSPYVSWVTGMYSDLYRVDENYVTTSKLTTDAIKSLNFTTLWAQGVGNITATSTTFTSTSSTFSSLMIGSPITINGAGAGGGVLVTTITGYTNSTTITVQTPALTSVTGGMWVVTPRNNWSYAGTFLDLANGNFYSPSLSMDASAGTLAIRGDVTASRFILTDTFGVPRGSFSTGAPTYAPDGSVLPNTNGSNQLDFSNQFSTSFEGNRPNVYAQRSWLEWNNKTGTTSIRADNGSGGKGSITSGTTTFTTTLSTSSFTDAMIGSIITITGAGFGGADLVTAIAGRSAWNSITLVTGASTTVVEADYKVVTEGIGDITSGSTTFIATGGLSGFVAGMVGSYISITGAGPSGTTLVAVVATYVDPYTVTLSTSASRTVVGAAWGLTHRTNRGNALTLDTVYASLTSTDYSQALTTTRRSYLALQPDTLDLLVAYGATGGGYRQRIYISPTNGVNIESDANAGSPLNYLGAISLRAGNTNVTGTTFNVTATTQLFGNFSQAASTTFQMSGEVIAYLQFQSTLGDKLRLWGTAYRFGVNGGELYYDSGGNHKHYTSGTLRSQLDSDGLRIYTTAGTIGLRRWTEVDGNWNGVIGSAGYLLIDGAYGASAIYLRTNNANPVYIGAAGSNTLTVSNGTATVASTLYVNSSVECDTISSNGGNLNLDGSGNYIYFNNWLRWPSPNGAPNYLAVDASGYIYTAASMRHLKEEIVPLPLDTGRIIDELEPVQFIFRNLHPEFGDLSPEMDAWRKADIKYGFIAEDVAAVDEKLARWALDKEPVLDDDGNPTYDNNNNPIEDVTGGMHPSAWDQDHMIAVIVKELQMLRGRVAMLEEIIERNGLK